MSTDSETQARPAPDRLSPNQDEFYAALMAAHAGLSLDDSHALNARLVLMMANRIGDIQVLETILRDARKYS
ncbi:DUF2783 domain-containing protein [Marinibacterium profundimaris]|uniref:DUF2783 domain-containing protein n=1 Tax=Marinibacterium profundimaris TaxID=1679460 RepID=A0A225NF82_9RHOB|nr:DUF2783 domain-containing protein [Marinibacterium profundimaris]OWU71667.1 hypothetical protein ATO3_17840 [Marinibacterium profundimaris]